MDCFFQKFTSVMVLVYLEYIYFDMTDVLQKNRQFWCLQWQKSKVKKKKRMQGHWLLTDGLNGHLIPWTTITLSFITSPSSLYETCRSVILILLYNTNISTNKSLTPTNIFKLRWQDSAEKHSSIHITKYTHIAWLCMYVIGSLYRE